MSKAAIILIVIAGVLVLGALGVVVFLSKSAPREPNYLVHGTVADLATGRPIVGARVEDDHYGTPPYRGGTTDSAGFYQYLTWAEEHNVAARAQGYKTKRELVRGESFGPEKAERVDFALEKE